MSSVCVCVCVCDCVCVCVQVEMAIYNTSKDTFTRFLSCTCMYVLHSIQFVRCDVGFLVLTLLAIAWPFHC